MKRRFDGSRIMTNDWLPPSDNSLAQTVLVGTWAEGLDNLHPEIYSLLDAALSTYLRRVLRSGLTNLRNEPRLPHVTEVANSIQNLWNCFFPVNKSLPFYSHWRSLFRMILEPLFNLVVSISTTLVSTVFRYFFPKKENDEERSWKQYMIYSIYAIIGMSILSITFLIHLGIGYFIHSGLSAGLRLQTEGLEFQVWYFF